MLNNEKILLGKTVRDSLNGLAFSKNALNGKNVIFLANIDTKNFKKSIIYIAKNNLTCYNDMSQIICGSISFFKGFMDYEWLFAL